MSHRYLTPVGSKRAKRNAGGGVNCLVTQLPVSEPSTPLGIGFFYDDFSADIATDCRRSRSQRIAFSADVKPPAGVNVYLDCQPAATPDFSL